MITMEIRRKMNTNIGSPSRKYEMNNSIAELSPNNTARNAGFMYLLYIISSIIADKIGHIGFGDAAVIVNTMTAHESIFRISFVIGLFSGVFFLLAAWSLYAVLKPVNKNMALLFLLLNLGGFVIWCSSMLNLFAGVLILSGADYLKVFPAEQLHALAMLFANLYKNGTIIAQVPYGLWVLPLGYLIFRSGFLPKSLGIVLMIDFVSVLIWFFQFFLLPDYPIIAYPCYVVSFLAEFGLTLWLLIKGVNVEKWKIVCLNLPDTTYPPHATV
jgi:hypothetical protein